MSRLSRAWQQLTQPDPAPDRQMSVVVTNPRGGDTIGPYRSFNRDHPLSSTTAAPGARQQWELHRAREESRDLKLRSPLFASYVLFERIQTVGDKTARLEFDRMTDEQKTRLDPVIRYLRAEWKRWQQIPGVGGAGQTVHQMAGQVLQHVTVDGDCFLVPRRRDGMRVWDLHPGDALAESSYDIDYKDGPNRILGVEVDQYNRPLAYYFGQRAKPARHNWAYTSYAVGGGDTKRIPAERVQHIRDRSGESTAVRGWPRCTPVIEYIARSNEWFDALQRSSTLRGSVGIALERDAWMGAADLTGSGGSMSDLAARSTQTTDIENQARQQDVPLFQEFKSRAGDILQLLPGFKPHSLSTGSPTSQEAEVIAMSLRLIASAFRVSPVTLYGDYSGVSFSAGQMALMQEQKMVEDRQMILANQYYTPLYRDWIAGRWMAIVRMFPGAINPGEDQDSLWFPTFRLQPYQILEKSKVAKPMLEVWNAGGMTFEEFRNELGYLTTDPAEVIAEWKKTRALLGLPESPGEATMPADEGGAPNDDDEEDDDDADT